MSKLNLKRGNLELLEQGILEEKGRHLIKQIQYLAILQLHGVAPATKPVLEQTVFEKSFVEEVTTLF